VTKPRNAPDELANMPIEELIVLSDRIEKLLAERVKAEKKALLAQLERQSKASRRKKIKDGKARSAAGLARP
jgi:hypothetical protein